MQGDDLGLVVFLGDYIFESSWGREHVRKHNHRLYGIAQSALLGNTIIRSLGSCRT